MLAQTFTDAFVVYSAKKFPGVPAMTALSLEFGKQGQKLPLVSDCNHTFYTHVRLLNNGSGDVTAKPPDHARPAKG